MSSGTVTPEELMESNTADEAIAQSPFSMNLNVGFSNATTTVYIAQFYSSDITVCDPGELTLLIFFGDKER